MAATTLFLIFSAFSWNSAQTIEHQLKHAAQFTGLDHVDVELVEDFRMLREALREGAAALDAIGQGIDGALEHDVLLLLGQHRETAQQRQGRRRSASRAAA